MQTDFTEEQLELRESVARFFARESSESEVRRLMETDAGYSSETWSRVTQELGLGGIAIPERFGGAGFGTTELMIVFEEMGRNLYGGPFFSSIGLAANLLLALGDEAAQEEFLPRIVSGETIATVAIAERDCGWDVHSITTTAVRGDTDWELTGVKSYVTDGHVADLFLVVARTESGLSVFATPAGSDGLVVVASDTLDRTRRLAEVTFTGAKGRLIGVEGGAGRAVDTMLDLGAIALAAEQVGGAKNVLDMALEYSKVRYQFGRPIGSFQVIKHRLADMLFDVESAASAAYVAGWTADSGDERERHIAASVAKAFCSEAYCRLASENIQIHGGIGFTWEHPAHLYFKRARSSELLLGSPEVHQERLLQALGS